MTTILLHYSSSNNILHHTRRLFEAFEMIIVCVRATGYKYIIRINIAVIIPLSILSRTKVPFAFNSSRRKDRVATILAEITKLHRVNFERD